MSRYSVEIKEQAQQDLKKLSQNEPKSYQKALALISELLIIQKQELVNPNNLKGMEVYYGAVTFLKSTV